MLKFKEDEIVALSMLTSFGVIDTKEDFYSEPHFGNTYFKNLMKHGSASKDIKLKSDEFLLSEKNPYKHYVKKFAEDKKAFFKVFPRAFSKMSRIGYEDKQLGNIEDLFGACEIRYP